MVKLKMSTNILKWTSPLPKLSRSQSTSLTTTTDSNCNRQNGLNDSNLINNSNNINFATKRWIHEDSLLVNGHVAYLVKFLGSIEVDEPKGLDVVKESIKKLEFQEHLKRSEGEKIRRVELTISVDGVAIRDPKTKNNIHQFPLHRISYCADDKSERKFLSFITKVQENSDRHECFVFVSDKLSEEITLTIGQAFDIAYRKYLDSSVHDFDTKKELLQARKKIQELERKVTELEEKLDFKDRNQDFKSKTRPKPCNLSSIKPIQTITTNSNTNQAIDLSSARSKLESLIDLP